MHARRPTSTPRRSDRIASAAQGRRVAPPLQGRAHRRPQAGRVAEVPAADSRRRRGMFPHQLRRRASCLRQSMPPCADADGLGRQPIFRRGRPLPDVPDAQRLLRAGQRRMYRGTAGRVRKVSLSGADRNRGRSRSSPVPRRRNSTIGMERRDAAYSYSSPKWARTIRAFKYSSVPRSSTMSPPVS